MVLAMTAVKRIRRKVVTLGFVLILGGLSIFYFTDMLSNITGLLYRDDTLTGRTEIWPKVVELVSNPIIGTGYRSFWLGERLKMMWVACGAEIQEAHNGYLEVYSELGVVGVILISGVLIAAMQSILKCLHDQVEYGSLRLAFLVITIIYNITESGFRVDLLIYFIFLLIAINFPRSYLTIARLREEIMKGR
jgi:O-antigen ligase